MQNKKLLIIFVFSLLILGATKSIASLTFSDTAITGSAPSSIDVGTGNTLSLQTTNNGPITTGTGLVTLGGALRATGATFSGLTSGRIPYVSTGGLLTDDSSLYYSGSSGALAAPSFYVGTGGVFSFEGGGQYIKKGLWFGVLPAVSISNSSGSTGDGTLMVGNVSVSNKVYTSGMNFSGLSVYANNAAALTGGLTAGDVYRTSTGVLMVVY